MLTRPLTQPLTGPLVRGVGEGGGNAGPFSATGAYTAVIGDSQDAGSPGSASWFNEVCRLSGQRMRYYINAGVSGNTTTQMLARINTDIITQSPVPNVCILGGCTNDFSNAIAPATTQQNIIDMVTALRSAGIKPILRNVPSRNTAGTGSYNTVALVRQGIIDHNAWLAAYCASEGIPLLDVYTPTFDGTGLTTAWTADGLHFNAAGCYAAASYVAARLPAYLNNAAKPYLTNAVSDSLSIVPNGIFSGDTNADGIANNWSTTSATAPALEANAYDGVGNWQNYTTSNGTLGYLGPGANPTAIAGHVYEVAALLRGAAGKTIKLRVQVRDGSNATLATLDVINDWTVQTANEVQTAFLRFTAPTNAAVFVITVQGVSTGATGQQSIARFTIRDRTVNP